MRILITGAEGMLGKELCRAGDGHEIWRLSRSAQGERSLALDIRNRERVVQEVTRINPEIVIHAAAYTNVDGSESEQEEAYRTNALGTRNLALACQRFDAAFLYISTDFVFDGKKGSPYEEHDSPNPQGTYARSKWEGEVFIRDLLRRFYIVRSGWLYGHGKKNFVTQILDQAKTKDDFPVVADQVGSPTFVRDLARAIVPLALSGAYGIYHITNGGFCSRYEFAREILHQAQRLELISREVHIRRCTSLEYPRPAPRPSFGTLSNRLYEMEDFPKLRLWQEALEEYMGELS